MVNRDRLLDFTVNTELKHLMKLSETLLLYHCYVTSNLYCDV